MRLGVNFNWTFVALTPTMILISPVYKTPRVLLCQVKSPRPLCMCELRLDLQLCSVSLTGGRNVQVDFDVKVVSLEQVLGELAVCDL